MDFFEDLANKGEIYSALEKQGLIRNLYDRECLDQAYDEGWDHGIDWDDEDVVGQLKQAKVFFLYYDYASVEIKERISTIYEPLKSTINQHGIDFLMINCGNKSIAAFGLGRKNRAFSKSCFNGSEFVSGVEEFDSSMPFGLALIFESNYESLGELLYDLDNIPANPDELGWMLDEEPDDDGLYWVDGYDEGFSANEINSYIRKFELDQEEVEGCLAAIKAYFPAVEIADISTGDYL
ncbi:hypothetical protein N9X12_04905 [Alphaproteobacteria bacterium]|nr:hypothetical protein [Alphaproteobacteria bacterium]